MKITMTMNGITVHKEIPTSWAGVTFEEFIKLAKCQTVTDKLSVFTGIEVETLKKAKINNLYQIIGLLSFTETKPEVSKIPEAIAGYRMPSNIETDEIGRFEDLKIESAKIKKIPEDVEISREELNEILESVNAYAMFCAIYATEPYDYKEAEKLKDVFMKAPCEEVVAIGNFTLLKLIELNNPGLLKPQSQSSLLKKWRQVMRGWLSRLAFTVRYYSWRRKLRLIEKSF